MLKYTIPAVLLLSLGIVQATFEVGLKVRMRRDLTNGYSEAGAVGTLVARRVRQAQNLDPNFVRSIKRNKVLLNIEEMTQEEIKTLVNTAISTEEFTTWVVDWGKDYKTPEKNDGKVGENVDKVSLPISCATCNGTALILKKTRNEPRWYGWLRTKMKDCPDCKSMPKKMEITTAEKDLELITDNNTHIPDEKVVAHCKSCDGNGKVSVCVKDGLFSEKTCPKCGGSGKKATHHKHCAQCSQLNVWSENELGNKFRCQNSVCPSHQKSGKRRWLSETPMSRIFAEIQA
jgi:hypothetical protein